MFNKEQVVPFKFVNNTNDPQNLILSKADKYLEKLHLRTKFTSSCMFKPMYAMNIPEEPENTELSKINR